MAKLSIVIPVYNEEKTICEIVARIKKVELGDLDKEIIIVDDFSTDGTKEQLREMSDTGIRIICHKKNLGKGAALRSGFGVVTGDYVIIQDADLEYDPREYPLLLRPLLENKADVVYGSRFMGFQPHRVIFFWHYAANKTLTLISNMFTNINLSDMETCYKAFRAEILGRIKLKENRFGFEPEFTIKISRLKLRVFEVGISYYGRTYDDGKKITWRDGFSAIWAILKYSLMR